MRIITKAIAALLSIVALSAAAQSPSSLKPQIGAPRVSSTETNPVPPSPSSAPTLTKADVDAWLDGYMPYALATGDIAGGVVVIVKDGQVLTQRGFGFADVKARRPVDPARTLFRPGSTSKLFTWTAVMQLVQAGRLDLDADINTYLDFRIPPAFGKPITMRNLMTHTAGLEETAKYLILFDKAQSRPLGEVLKRYVPKRIYAPGTMPAYSNYGASLAGYVVQRVSGEPFADYIRRHIYAPLGMAHSSFKQPLPPALAPGMSSGYNRASQGAERFEIIDLAPAGSMSSTGADMARFMVAHLADGGPLLNPQTAQLMHSTANTPIAGLPGMALGFYHEDRNGLRIIGHGGDTNFFHSDLHLFLDKGVGMFMSVNSGGKEGAAHLLRERLFAGFTDRYFPQTAPTLPTTATVKAHGEAMAGHYVSSRGSNSTFLRFVTLLGETQVMLNDDDTITVSSLTNAAGVPKRWREVGPWQWVEVGGDERLAAIIKDGRVAVFSIAQFAPIIEFLPAPFALNAGWILPSTLAALGVMLFTALSWPVVALVRRRYGYRPEYTTRSLLLHRASRITAWIMLIIAAGWLAILAALSSDVATFDGRLDIWMRLLQLLSVVAIVGTALSVWNASVVARGPRRRMATIWAVLFAVAALFLVWLAFDVRLITLSLNY